MRKMAGILILSLMMQLVMPMSVRAAETDSGGSISTMELGERNEQEKFSEAGEYDAQANVMANDRASSIDTKNAIEIEGFIQEKYYRREDGYALFIGAAMPEWDAGTTELTNVAYQIDDGSLTVLGTVSSDEFVYRKYSWSNDYGGCLTLTLDSKPSVATEGTHLLAVYFTVGQNDYKIVGTTMFVNEWVGSEGIIQRSWGTEYFPYRKGSVIQQINVRGYTFKSDEQFTKVQLISPETKNVVLTAPMNTYANGNSSSGRYSLFYKGKDGLWYSMDNKIIPIEYETNNQVYNIELTKDIPEGYYDLLAYTSNGTQYRAKNAYYVTKEAVVCGARIVNGTGVFFSDNTGNYISAYVYGFNLSRDNIPTFYDSSNSTVLASYIDNDSDCGCEYDNERYYYRLKKGKSNLGNEEYVNSHVTLNGDVLYQNDGGKKYYELGIDNKGIFCEEYLQSGQLYEGSAGRSRFYIGEGINCNVGDTVTYELRACITSNNISTYTDIATVQRNENGKYIEFDENSNIYKFYSKRYDFKLIKGNTVLTSSKASRVQNIQIADSLVVPSGCSWEIHAIGEITKTLYSGTNTSSNTVSVLTNAQLSKLAQMGTVRVCIYNADGTVRERKLVYFQQDDSTISFPINVEIFSDWQVKVVDYKGQPVQDAEVTYRKQTKMTSEKGIVTLTDYVPGSPLSISKSGYITYTVDSFVKEPTGCTTCRLLNADGTFEYAYMTLNGKVTDLLTKEATINTYYKTTDFTIDYKVYGTYETCELYSGKKKITESSDGKFSNLRFSSFQVGEPVYLYVKRKQAQSDKIKVGIQVIKLDPKVLEFSIGDDTSIKAPDQIPIIGGSELKIDLGALPVQWKISADDKIQIGINVTELAKKEKDWFSILKKLNKNNCSKYLTEEYEKDKKDKKDEIKPKVMGYLEGPITNSDYLKGKLLIELSVKYNRENQYSIVGIPVVVEVSISGKANADGSITFTAEQGFSGGTLKIGGEIGAGLYGGVGLAKVASAGVYGEAAIGLKYDIFPVEVRGINEFYVKGNAGVKVKVLGKNVAKYTLVDGTWYIINNDTSVTALADDLPDAGIYHINNNAVYENLSRDYLESDGTMTDWAANGQTYEDGSVNETILQGAACLDIIPQVIRMGDMVMLFYLTDAGAERDTADRSMLVYSIWNQTDENWSAPKAVLDDGTADYEPDLYTDGTKIYAVWQNAEESLVGNLTLNEIADRLVLHAAVYDEEQDGFVSLGDINSGNGLFQQKPQIVANGDNVSVYWYENEQDNVLGLSGTNRIYQAVLLEDGSGRKEIQSVSEEKDSDLEGVDEEDLDVGDSAEEDSDTELEPGTEEFDEEEKPDTDESDVEKDDTDQSDMDDSDIQQSDDDSVIFTKYVAVYGEDSGVEEETEETTTESDQETGEMTDDWDQEQADETVSENTIPGETISDNTISENTIQIKEYDPEESAGQSWTVTFLQDETECIISADAGRASGRIGYAYVAGQLDSQNDVSQGKVVFLAQGEEAVTLDRGALGNVEFTPVYAGETLTWYRDGDICYVDENGDSLLLLGESRLPSSAYVLLSDGTGSPEILFPVNLDGKSNLYRIGYENGKFLPALQVTDQEDYIQYTDGFINDGKTILVYNKMEVNDALEEINNSLCMGTLTHSYLDVVVQNAGSMIRQDAEMGEDVLEITAQLYNNGTVTAEGLNLSLAKSDGTVLETVAIDALLEPGETGYGTAVFSLDHVKEEAEYMVTVSGTAGSDIGNNSSSTIVLGEASLQVAAELISVSDTRELHVGIQNTGITSCGGTVSVRDAETGAEYCSSTFEPIAAEQTAFAQIDIDTDIFEIKDAVALEVVVEPDDGTADVVREFVTVFAPTYAVTFVTDTEESVVYVNHGEQTDFPENPAREGAYFIGWYDSRDTETGMFYTEETPITEDVTLYAHFEEKESSILMENCSVSGISSQLYTGKAIKPSVTVKWGGEILSVKKDYSVSYHNNKEQGTATVTITGKGRFSGTITRTFTILYPISKVTVSGIPSVNYSGENHTPDVTVIYNKKALVKNRDYTVSYFNNRNAGTAGVTITGKGSYMGTKTVTFQIKGTSITGMVFDKISNVTYSCSGFKPIITVKTQEGIQLRSGADYRVVYENTVNKGTATVTVIGNGNYTGTKKLTYKVLAKPLTEEMVSKVEAVTYTGNTICPDITVTDDGAELIRGQDYTVTYSKNKTVGTAIATIKGKGNYSGTVKIPFTIRKYDLENNAQIRVQVSDIAYTGKAVKPKVQVYDGTKKLSAGAYTLFYMDNVEKGTGTVTVTGKGNYTGTVTAKFKIVDKAKLITSLKVDKLTDFTYTGTAIEPDVVVKDASYTLVRGVDYETTYSNQYNAGKATVTITGIGSYAGSKDVTYKINRRMVADKNGLGADFVIKQAQLSNEKYTGYALKPDVDIMDHGRRLVLGKDYKLSYKKNTNIGTATVTLTGIGNYCGSYSAICFNIVGWDYNDLRAEIEDQVYTGKAIKPKAVFYHDGEKIELKSGTAVKFTYIDNKNAGTAVVTITGKGELKNMNPITVNFTIEQADLEEAVINRIANQTLKGVAVKPVPKVKVGRNTLKAGRDFTLSYLRNGVKGEAEVIITGIGNYTGECRKNFIVQ